MALAKPKQDTIAALDIGTTKVVCFIGTVEPNGEVLIEGIGHQLSSGARSGTITDIRAAEASIVGAVHAAEQMAGKRIEEVYVNIFGGGLTSHNLYVDVPLSNQAISARDSARLMEYGKASLRNVEREIIYCQPLSYSIDEARGIRDPIGMYGRTLGANLHIMTASANALKNLRQCVARAQLDAKEFLVSSFASGLACLTEDEIQLGVTLIDIGGGTTSVAVFVDGKLVFTDWVPVGGMFVTNDIARGLSISVGQAERIKALYGGVYASLSDAAEMIEIPSVGQEDGLVEPQSVSRSMLVGIIRPRMEEVLEMVRAKVEAGGFDRVAGRRVVVTGGGSQLMGTADLAAQIFNKQVRMARPKALQGLAESTGGFAFATCVGMMEHAAGRVYAQRQRIEAGMGDGQGAVARALQWFREKI